MSSFGVCALIIVWNKKNVKSFFEKLIEDSKNAKSGQEQFELHKKYYEFIGDVYTNLKLGVFRHNIDTTEEFYSKENDYIDEITPLIVPHFSPVRGFLLRDIAFVSGLLVPCGAVRL